VSEMPLTVQPEEVPGDMPAMWIELAAATGSLPEPRQPNGRPARDAIRRLTHEGLAEPDTENRPGRRRKAASADKDEPN
jgi:hypothetical protein